MLPDIVDHPCRPRHMSAVRNVEVLDLVEGVGLGEAERDSPVPDRAANRKHLVRHHRRVFHRVPRGLHHERDQLADRDRSPRIRGLEPAHADFVIAAGAVAERFEFFAIAILRDQMTDRSGRVDGRRAGLTALETSAQKRSGALSALGS